MKRVLIVAAICAIAVPAFASPELTIGQVKGVNSATYNMSTGELAPAQDSGRATDVVVWSSITDTGYYFGSMANGFGAAGTPQASWLVLDWGDIADGTVIGGYQAAYATDLSLPDRFDMTNVFYGDYAGGNNAGFFAIAGFIIADLPAAFGTYNGWTITIDIEDPNDYSFPIAANDLDADGLADFGYDYWFPTLVSMNPASATGPFLAGEPNNPDAPGAYNAFDGWQPTVADPNYFEFTGTWWFGGDPFAQFYMELYEGGIGGCEYPGASGNYCTADVEPDVTGDCDVDLGDLAVLLANFNVMTGMTHYNGDIEPIGGDGDVDLGDLAMLLAQFGDDCLNAP